MFPNFRLMIAAIAASVVALSCGFGVFAAFRVNHDPVGRLPPATTPMQLVAALAAASVEIAVPEPLDRRLEISEPQKAGPAMELLTPEQYARNGVESAPAVSAVMPSGDAAEVEETAALTPSAESVVVVAAAALPAVPPATAPAAAIGTPAAEPLALGDTAPEATSDATPADAASSPQQASAVAIAPPMDSALPAAAMNPHSERAPARLTRAAEDATHKPARKVATHRRTHVARIYRTRWLRGDDVGVSDAQYLNRDSAYFRQNLQASPQSPQPRLTQGQRPRSKVASTPPEGPASAIGGPFVNPPSR